MNDQAGSSSDAGGCGCVLLYCAMWLVGGLVGIYLLVQFVKWAWG